QREQEDRPDRLLEHALGSRGGRTMFLHQVPEQRLADNQNADGDHQQSSGANDQGGDCNPGRHGPQEHPPDHSRTVLTTLYPAPRTVAMYRGRSASSPSFSRNLPMWTSIVRSSASTGVAP